MRSETPLPVDTILAAAARPGRPLFVRRAEWPRGQWVAVERHSGRIVILRDRSPAEEAWRGETPPQAGAPDSRATGEEAA